METALSEGRNLLEPEAVAFLRDNDIPTVDYAFATSREEAVAAVKSHVPEADIRGAMIVPMAASGTELIVGMVRDPQFGPVIMFGLGGVFFAAISGSGVATAAAMGSIMIPAMVNRGYDKGFASAVVASASPIGVVIPPSISFIVYAVLTSTSVTDLYQAGIPAGMIMGVFLMGVAYFISRKKGYKGDEGTFSRKEFIAALKDASWALGTPVILIGGVFGGMFTPTESAVVAVVYAIVIGLFMYREIKWSDLPEVFLSSAVTTAKIMLIISMALCFAYLLTYNRVPQRVLELFMGLSDNKYVVLMIINLLLLVAGTFMETSAILLITVPILLPVLAKFDINLVHFGIIICANTAIGLMTPPFGVCLFTTSSIGGTSIQELSRRIIPFLVALILSVGVITYIPESIMFMVNLW